MRFHPSEEEFRRWIREELKGCLTSPVPEAMVNVPEKEPMLSRDEMAGLFKISFMTLNAWMSKGLPHYRQSRRVFFLRSEIMEFLKVTKRKKNTF
ncbi:MAG: helix-turn-helix domain-containing protein [Chitinophagaceae bacterium]